MAKPLNEDQKKYLNDLYYNKKMYFGRDKLYNYIHTNNLEQKITKRQVQNFLNSQEVHQIYYKTPIRKTTKPNTVKKNNTMISIDLMDLSNYETKKGNKWIFTAIDNHNRRGFAQEMKNKDINNILVVLKSLVKYYNPLKILRCDNGSEFTNKKFVDLMKLMKIKIIYSKSYTPQSNGLVERFNESLKQMIFKAIKKDREWDTYLNQLVENYNNTVQRSIKECPNYKKDDEPKPKEKKKKINEESKFKVGDNVRLKLNKNKPDYNKSDGNFSQENFTIEQIFKHRKENTKNQYKLKNDNKKYFACDLLLIPKETKEEIERLYEVSRIVRPIILNNEQYYIIKWKGIKMTELNKYQPRKNLIIDIPKKIKQFEKLHNVKWDMQKNKVTYKKK
jgi:putative transposase